MNTLKVQLGSEQTYRLTFSEEWDSIASEEWDSIASEEWDSIACITYVKAEIGGKCTVVSIEDLKAAVKAMGYLVNANLGEWKND